MQKLFIGLTLLVSYSYGFIVPQELPSILSLVYSNIPQIKKGTDSRFGFGFRLGEHADFQVLLELGPQKFTKPLGEGAESSDTSKRMVDQSDYGKQAKPNNVSGKEWLNTWASDMRSETMRNSHKQKMNVIESNPMRTMFSAAEQYPIPRAPVIAESALRQLQGLYGKSVASSDAIESNVGALPAHTMAQHIRAAQTSANKEKLKADLMDVSLD